VVRTARERTIARRVRRLVPDAAWAEIEPRLPPPPPTPRGGRPRTSARAALAGIVHVLRRRISWANLPQELGFGSGMTCWRRLREWQAAGVWPEIEEALSRGLAAGEALPWERVEPGVAVEREPLASASPRRDRARSGTPARASARRRRPRGA